MRRAGNRQWARRPRSRKHNDKNCLARTGVLSLNYGVGRDVDDCAFLYLSDFAIQAHLNGSSVDKERLIVHRMVMRCDFGTGRQAQDL
jgi:hypothetical protein